MKLGGGGDSGPDDSGTGGPVVADRDYVSCTYAGSSTEGEAWAGRFDALGRAVEAELTGQSDPEADYHRVYEYDAGDKLVDRLREDTRADGSDDLLSTLTWLAEDQPLVRDDDEVLDGTVDTRSTWEWLGDGWVEHADRDDGADGRLIRYELDDDEDGEVDYAVDWTWTCP